MEPLRIGTEDLIYHAFYLIKSRTKAVSPSLSYAQVNKYIEDVKAGLDQYNINYEIFNGATKISANKGFRQDVFNRMVNVYMINDKQNKRYVLPSEIEEDILYARTSSVAPLFLRGFLEPIGYEEVLNLNAKSKESEPGDDNQ